MVLMMKLYYISKLFKIPQVKVQMQIKQTKRSIMPVKSK